MRATVLVKMIIIRLSRDIWKVIKWSVLIAYKLHVVVSVPSSQPGRKAIDGLIKFIDILLLNAH